MWPWGHLAVGYVAFSLFVRVQLESLPSDRAAIVLAVATQLPDLVDKPLAWQLGLLSNGVGVAHSLLVGVPLALVAGFVLWNRGRRQPGAALAIGYVGHVAGDLLFGALFGEPPLLPAFLWPLYGAPPSTTPGFGLKVWELLLNSRALLGSATGRTYFALVALLVVATVALWVVDGAPGLGPLRRFVRDRRAP